MKKLEVRDNEVIQVMKDGGLKLVEYARKQWLSGIYDMPGGDNHEFRQIHLNRWKEIEQRIPELAQLLKEVVCK
jgi:hypothetical protein